jgi:hypothetical protein
VNDVDKTAYPRGITAHKDLAPPQRR